LGDSAWAANGGTDVSIKREGTTGPHVATIRFTGKERGDRKGLGAGGADAGLCDLGKERGKNRSKWKGKGRINRYQKSSPVCLEIGLAGAKRAAGLEAWKNY